MTQALTEYRQHIDALNAEANRHLAEIKRIEEVELHIEHSVMGSTTVLEKISSLGVGKFDY